MEHFRSRPFFTKQQHCNRTVDPKMKIKSAGVARWVEPPPLQVDFLVMFPKEPHQTAGLFCCWKSESVGTLRWCKPASKCNKKTMCLLCALIITEKEMRLLRRVVAWFHFSLHWIRSLNKKIKSLKTSDCPHFLWCSQHKKWAHSSSSSPNCGMIPTVQKLWPIKLVFRNVR